MLLELQLRWEACIKFDDRNIIKTRAGVGGEGNAEFFALQHHADEAKYEGAHLSRNGILRNMRGECFHINFPPHLATEHAAFLSPNQRLSLNQPGACHVNVQKNSSDD